MLGYHTHPGTKHPLGPCTPQTMHHHHHHYPPQDHAHPRLGDTVNARAVRILLECNLVIDLYVSEFFKTHMKHILSQHFENDFRPIR